MDDPKTYLVVGGATGIGAAVVQQLEGLGHRLIVTSRSPDTVLAGDGIAAHHFDASRSDQSLSLPESLDGVVYCPGSITLKPFTRTTRVDFENDLEVNLHGAVSTLQQALPALKRVESASIVLFGSVAATTGLGFHASVAAAKGAVEGLGKALAAELAPKIRVNVVSPSLTDTPLAGNLLASHEKRELAADRHPLKTVGRPQDIAQLVTFLLSDASSFMTGQVLRPDGGLSSVRLF